MPRKATSGPLDKLRGPVRKVAEEVFSIDTDRSVLKDEPLMNGLSELQTKQALKVLDTYCQNVQRQGSGRIQNKAAYLMSLIQSYKLGPSSGTPGSAQRLIERLSPAVRRAVEGVFDPVVDRVVLEDRALMELLAKVPEEQALAALKKYRATVQRRGRDAIDNRCGYLIGFLKQYQDGVAVVGVSNNNNFSHQHGPSRGAPSSMITSNGDGHVTAPPKAGSQTASASNGHSIATGSRSGPGSSTGGISTCSANVATKTQASGQAPGLAGASGVRPISYLQEPVRKQLEKLFESGKDKAVLEDVGLIKQLARLGEEQALAALKNYKEASKHRRDIHNKSAYLMGILRGYIEGTTPISKAPWESGGNGVGGNGCGSSNGSGSGSDDGPELASSASTTASAPAPNGASVSRSRVGHAPVRASGVVIDDTERAAADLMSNTQSGVQQQPSPSPPPPPPPPQKQLSPATAPVAPSSEVPGPREFGSFANAPPGPRSVPPQQAPHQKQQQPVVAQATRPMSASNPPSSASPLTSTPLGGGGLFLSGVGLGSGSSVIGDVSQQRYDPSNGLLYMDDASIGVSSGVSGFGVSSTIASTGHHPPRHASQHESLFGHAPVGGSDGGQQHQHQTLVGPGLLGGEFLLNGGGSDRGLVHPPANGGASKSSPPANPVGVLFGSGLLAGDELGAFANGHGNGNGNVPASPASVSGLGSTSALGSSSRSGSGSPLGSEGGGHDTAMTTGSTNADVPSSVTSGTGNSNGNGSTNNGIDHSHGPAADWQLRRSSVSPRSGSPGAEEGEENVNSSETAVSGMVDMLARLNLSKYVPVLAEAEVDMDALRLFGEDDLKDLGFPKGPRIKLLHEVQNLNFTRRA